MQCPTVRKSSILYDLLVSKDLNVLLKYSVLCENNAQKQQRGKRWLLSGAAVHFTTVSVVSHERCFARCKTSFLRARIGRFRIVYDARVEFYVSLSHVLCFTFAEGQPYNAAAAV